MTAWHRQQYRIELCTVENCVSSPRISLSGLAANTLDSLSPAIFLKVERYAEQMPLDHDATLAVLTLQVEGALDIRARIGGQWILMQRLRLDALAVSTSPENLAEPVINLNMIDSLRAPPTDHPNPALVFTADASLSIVALGRRSKDDSAATSKTVPDAALSTYVYNPQTRQWLSGTGITRKPANPRQTAVRR